MARSKLKLTEARINRLPPSSSTVFCGELKGFGVRVREVDGKRTYTFVVQRDLVGPDGVRRTKTVTYPHKGKDELANAREWAKDIVRAMERGEDPTVQRTSCTLRAALDKHVKGMTNRGASPRSIKSLRYRIEHYAVDLLDRDLATIKRPELEALHDAISAKGKYVANNTLRHVQMLFNTARKKLGFDHLDKEVTAAVDFHKQERRREPVQDLAAWWTAVQDIDNPVRRDLWLFILFTGLRRDDAKMVRWEHINFDAGTIHRPQPKGGKDRAFTVPLPRFLLDLLWRRKLENGGADAGWCFPTTACRDGQLVVTHVVEVKQQEYYKDAEGKRRKRAHSVMKSPHRLRDTFASAAKDAGLDWFTLKVLMNHRLPSGDVTAGYVLPGLDGLRAATEKVAALLLERAGQPGYAKRLEAEGAACPSPSRTTLPTSTTTTETASAPRSSGSALPSGTRDSTLAALKTG